MKLKNSFQEYDMAVNLLLNSPKRAAKIFVTVEVASLTTNLVQPMPQLETRFFAVIKPFQPLVWIQIKNQRSHACRASTGNYPNLQRPRGNLNSSRTEPDLASHISFEEIGITNRP